MSDENLSTQKLVKLGARLAEEHRVWLEDRPLVSPEDRLSAVKDELARRVGAAPVATPTAPTAPTGRRTWGPLALSLAAAIAVLAALSLFVPRDRERVVVATSGGQPVHVGDRLVARSRPVNLTFEDGSSVDLDAGAETFVSALGDEEIRLRMLRGEAHVRVVHREGRTWWLHGGEHAVQVVGTAFRVRYEDATGTLDIDLEEGKVRIVGPCADGAIVHHAPVRISAGCARVATSASGAGVRPAPFSAASSSATTGTAEPSGARAAPPLDAWRAARERGDLRAAFELASEVGLDNVAATANAAELVDLALGARLAGSRSEASRLYHRTRERWGGTEAAATAAFHLGRLAFDEAGAWSEAERWFSIYLAERPSGALAAEALGRSMEAAERQGSTDRARGHAAAYLARFPSGPLAGRAQKLVDTSGASGDRAPRAPP